VFLSDTRLTVGVDFLNKIVPFGDLVFNFAIWDLGGQDQFRFILKSYVRGAHAGLLFFALDRIQSFLNLNEWMQLLRGEKPDLPLVLIGTKADLEEKDMCISEEDINAFIKNNKIVAYFRTSSKTGENIAKPIEILAEHFFQKYR
jgi:small GTP-binding protein